MTDCDRRSFIARSGATVAAFTLLPELAAAAPRVRGAALPVAVIGVGRQGRAILGELQKIDAVEVVAICDEDERRLRSGGRRAAGAEMFAAHGELLDRRPDVKAVFVATPTHWHRAIMEDAIASGRHVYCEAPIATTVEDCRAMAAASRAASVVVQAGLLGRSNPIYRLARTFFRSDAVRTLVSMRAQNNRKTTWRSPASDAARDKALNWRLDPDVSIGLAGELGTHQFDVAHWFTSEYPTEVRGTGSIRLRDDGRTVFDTIACDLAFPGGPHLAYQATLANSFEGRNEVFLGTNATIKLAATAGWMFKEADAPTQGWEVYANRQQFHNDEGITLIADATKLAEQGKLTEGVTLPYPPLYYGLADFLKSVLEDEPVVCTIQEGARATIVGINANLAVTTGAAVANVLEG